MERSAPDYDTYYAEDAPGIGTFHYHTDLQMCQSNTTPLWLQMATKKFDIGKNPVCSLKFQLNNLKQYFTMYQIKISLYL